MMKHLPPLTPEQAFMLRLEMERNDLSYLHSRKAEPEVVKVIVKEKVYPNKRKQAFREQMMFNAGRYAAGARDKTAETAHLWLDKTLAEEERN